MPGNKTATARGLALGAALREARVRAGHGNLTKFAGRLRRPAATVSRWETGQRMPRPEDVAQYLTILEITGETFEDIVSLTRDADSSSWLANSLPEQRRHLDALLRLERDATELTAVNPLMIPGWLQDQPYIRAIMTAGGVPEDEIESRILTRLGRREVLSKARLTALIGQAALLQEIGGRQVLRGQLQYLLTVSEKIDLRVVPFSADWHPALEGAWSVIRSANGVVVYIEKRKSGLFLHEEADIDAYLGAVDSVRDVAMSPQDSVGLIAEVINNLEK